MSVDGDSVVTISPDTLTFSSTDGTTPKPVTVTAVSDDDPLNEAAEIRHTVSIGSNDFLTALLPVRVTDDDAPVLTLVSTTSGVTFPADVSEGYVYDGLVRMNEGDPATYTVRLSSEPPGDTAISLYSSNSNALTVNPNTITFSRTDAIPLPNTPKWNEPQTVTLSAVADSDASDELVTVYHEKTIGGVHTPWARCAP